MAALTPLRTYNPMLREYNDIQKEFDTLHAIILKTDPEDPGCPTQAMNGMSAITVRVCYVETDAGTGARRQKEYMVKHIKRPNEAMAARIYNGLSRNLPGTFRIPQGASINMKEKLHISPDGTARSLTQSDVDAVSSPLRAITEFACTAYPGKGRLRRLGLFEDHVILLSEAIPGSDLRAFSVDSYYKLSKEQKDDLFTKFGKIALLDFVLGNTDRLIRVKVDTKCEQPCEFRSCEANFGNIMITWSEETKDKPPAIHLIDNGIFHEDDPSLCLNSRCQELYNIFLLKVCEKPSMETELTDKAIEHMTVAYASHYDTYERCVGKALDREAHKRAFHFDLQEFGGNAMRKGILWMQQQLCTELIPKWTKQMTQHLPAEEIFPALCQSIQTRFEVFQRAAAMRANQLPLPMPQPEGQAGPEEAAPL